MDAIVIRITLEELFTRTILWSSDTISTLCVDSSLAVSQLRADLILVVNVLTSGAVSATIDAVAELRGRVYGDEYPLADPRLVTVATD